MLSPPEESDSTPRRCAISDSVLVAALALWLLVVLGAMIWLNYYKAIPGPGGQAPPRWPVESRLHRARSLPTLILFAHPKCPCTQASLSELRVVLSSLRDKVAPEVVFLLPNGTGNDWRRTAAWRTAESIPGVHAFADAGGVETARFGAQVSGQVVLYGADGWLLFQGGITGSRGHEGANPGRSRLMARLTGGASNTETSLVYGCGLDDVSKRR